MSGTFFAVVGPSGAGKDTLIDFAREALADVPHFAFPRRVITRPQDAGGEDHIAVTQRQFDDMRTSGGFLIAWDAHGLSYGVPADVGTLIGDGVNVVINLSRAAIEPLCARIAHVEVLHVTAPLEVIAERLAGRGRETPESIRERLARAGYTLPDAARVTTIVNDGPPENGGKALIDLLRRHCRPAQGDAGA